MQEKSVTGEDLATISPLLAAVVSAVEDKKAQDVTWIDVRGRCGFTDFFVLATGRTDRQLNAIAQSVSEAAHSHQLSAAIEGREAMEWLVIDLNDVVVHLFLSEVRDALQLESLWRRPTAGAVA
ncbi:MAG: ribosome silencing factor [Zetaproteobacteria bacterium]|nr:ribosome silencing factor [Zetaproteobacteria bacterium]